MLFDRFLEAIGDGGDGGGPIDSPAVPHGIEQPAVMTQGLGQGRALGTEPPEIRRMPAIAGDNDFTARIAADEDAATDAAIGTGGLNGGAQATSTAALARSSEIMTTPCSTRTG